jgi:uncharacterized protein YbjT (DUF2867 family)
MTREILVPGATGFVGRQVVRTLSKEDVELHLVVREGKQGTVADYFCLTD